MTRPVHLAKPVTRPGSRLRTGKEAPSRTPIAPGRSSGGKAPEILDRVEAYRLPCSIFPVRGQPDDDRQYRHPRIRSSRQGSKRDTAKVRRSLVDSGAHESTLSLADEWESLPPLEEVLDSVSRFTLRHFQLGFLPKKQFVESLRRDHHSVNLFLLLSILSVSARLSPPLIRRFGTGVKASEFFIERASAIAVHEVYEEPATIERCQAFYLLSIAQQGNGIRVKSHVS